MGITLALDLLQSIWNCSTTMQRSHTVDPSLMPAQVTKLVSHAKFCCATGVLYLLRKVSFATPLVSRLI